MIFERGQKSKLSGLTPSTRLEVGIRVARIPGNEIDFTCFGLDSNGQLSDDRYMVFYNQPASPCGSIKVNSGDRGFDKVFAVNLDGLPSSIERLVFCGTIDGPASMGQLPEGKFAIIADDREVMSYSFAGNEFGQEKAIMIGEVYMKTVWRVAAVGQGFSGGLAALLKHFGGKVKEEVAAAPPPSAAPGPSAIEPAKVTLEKRGSSQKVSLKKRGSSVIHVNLNWDSGSGKRSWLGVVDNSGVDLDLGCMFELETGEKGVIQPLGGVYGEQHRPPFILLDKDDRSGSAVDGENMRFYRPELIRRVLIFALIYEGTANFSDVNGRVTIRDQEGSEILVRCDAPDPSRTFCAVCMIEAHRGEIKITKEERYFHGHPDCDAYYRFGFRWVKGTK